ncbi:MAG TPA: MoaD family protein [Thermomicrobiales bacterium]|nr:MoaD family protein [Thermomicrobiales bacterium]
MKVTLRFFAIVRERIGESERVIELPSGSNVADALAWVGAEFADIAPLFRTSMVMRNQEYVDAGEPLADGDEIAFIPPVSGGAGHYRVTDEQLDAAQVTRHVERRDAGAVVTFVGTVRDNARGRAVLWLDYEAYAEAAEKMLARIGDEMRERWPVLAVAIEHRTGQLYPGEASVVIAVSSAHRDAVFASAAYAIERIKQIVPVWKKEAYADGETWIGSEAAYQVEIGRAPASS